MKKEKDEELDKLFKKGADNPVNDPVFREADWDALEQMLDQRKKRGGIIYWLPRLGSVAALLLLFLGWMLLKPQVVKHHDNQQVATVPSKPDTNISGGSNRHRTADSSKHKILNPAGYAQNPDHPGAGKKTNRSFPYPPVEPAAKLPGNGSGKDQVMAKNVKDKKELGTADANKDQNKADGQAVASANGRNQEKRDKKELGTVDYLSAKGIGVMNQTVLADNTVVSLDNYIAFNYGPPLAQIIDKAPLAKVAITNKSRPQFALSAIASSDMNGTSPLNSGRLGGNFGALFSVSSGKWTFSTGGMYSIKPYQESFANYHTSYAFQTNPTSVGANCRMIDIPLNVNYQVYKRGVNKFTVGTGFSSYIILREDYTFNYANSYNYNNSYNPQGPASYSVVNRNRNIMSILNLDATYERKINSKFGLVLQPYMKLPLSNVGASQVKLQSTGVAVGLNWYLNSFKKPD